MAAYVEAAPAVAADDLRLLDPVMLPGILIGAVLPFLFTSLTMTAVGKAAQAIVVEVRRQFRDIPGLMEGTARPDYKTCVGISTQGALREMMIPGGLAVIVPLLVGYILGAEALAGMLIGAIVSGFLLAVMMANAGGAWDNAKKWIESGELGGRGSAIHRAAVVGDTVGDPFKDTSGPSLNILIKLMSIVSLVFAATFSSGIF
jgi:K(+)-stimulated pyrophosphate-energized sodium pump